MRKLLTTIGIAAALVALPVYRVETSLAQATPRAGAAKRERHPHIRAAIRELEAAKKELQSAAHDFGGHRVAALKAIDETLLHLREALKNDKK